MAGCNLPILSYIADARAAGAQPGNPERRALSPSRGAGGRCRRAAAPGTAGRASSAAAASLRCRAGWGILGWHRIPGEHRIPSGHRIPGGHRTPGGHRIPGGHCIPGGHSIHRIPGGSGAARAAGGGRGPGIPRDGRGQGARGSEQLCAASVPAHCSTRRGSCVTGTGDLRESCEPWPRAALLHQCSVSPRRDLWELPAKVVMMEVHGKQEVP